MVGPVALAAVLFAPAAPVPVGPPAPAVKVDPEKLTEFGNLVYAAAMQVSTHRRDVQLPDLAADAVRGLYEEARQPVPAGLLDAVRAAKKHEERMALIGEARGRLAAAPELRGPRAFLAAAHGFRHQFDQYSGLAAFRPRGVSVEMDFGLGFELDGVEGRRLAAFQLERMISAGEQPATGLLGPPPRPGAVPSPAAFPWRVRRVVPGSPAHRAGLKAGDVITHLNDAEILRDDADAAFARLAFPPESVPDPKSGQTREAKFTFHVRRGVAPTAVELTTEYYRPVTVFGVVLRGDGSWDGMLDPDYRIGYVRVGSVEGDSDRAVAAVVADLARRGCRGLILDLRWCPGGYVDPGAAIAGMFLTPGATIARVQLLPNLANGPSARHMSHFQAVGGYADLPLAVLVGGETVGGGELIAAALQDHNRATIVGQRTVGRAATMELIDLGYAGVQFKATYGTTLRANGKTRHRTATSSPADDWGVRPDPGFEVPLTPAVAVEVRGWAEDHGLRPPGGRAALPFDDPDRDPPRAAALAHLRKRLGRPAPPAAVD